MNTEKIYISGRISGIENEEKKNLSAIQLLKIDVELENLKNQLKSLNF